MNAKLKQLLADFGYRVAADTIVQIGVRGHSSDRVWGRCRDLFDAAERLCPIIHNDDFTTRLVVIQGATPR